MIEEKIQISNDDYDRVLKVCVCGNHHNDNVPIAQLVGAGVVIYYVDEKDDVIKLWKPDIQQEREKAVREFVALIASPEYPSDWEVPNGAILARMEQYLSQQPKDYTKAIDEKFNNPLEQLDNIVDETFNPKEQNK